ncbi:MAG: hypothetical protein MRQ11_03175 [Candidatus Midichloria mitochondrii]|uniref:hypothetical protein n=1 Tax=Candidatus Midichloria mitochondrii TaxID=234827 RepID=UPI00135F118A|nr:hypothetical protein [Candidatus Midichloria mitochondrii]MDJ1583681.1 hypothetical protein [Candidatus Midichloria mitochondrii]
MIETAIGQRKRFVKSSTHGIARQSISWQGSWLMSSNPIYLMEKNRLAGLLLTSN